MGWGIQTRLKTQSYPQKLQLSLRTKGDVRARTVYRKTQVSCTGIAFAMRFRETAALVKLTFGMVRCAVAANMNGQLNFCESKVARFR